MEKTEGYFLAERIVKALQERGFAALFAGGWVRDYLMGHSSSEIDIATSATPEDIIPLFEKTIPVGIAFGVVIVVLEGHSFELSTFRKDGPYLDGRHPQTIEYSNPEHDARRRDFTINGMFYNPVSDQILDYVGGREDIQKGVIRAIGEPHSRFTEDRLRMMRAVRFAARFNFTIEEKTKEAILQGAHTLLPATSMERISQEFFKMQQGHLDKALIMLHELGLLAAIFPELGQLADDQIRKRVNFIPYLPQRAPFIVSLLELFQEKRLDEKIEIAKRLKLDRDNIRLIEYLHEGKELLFASQIDRVRLAHFFANPTSNLAIDTIVAMQPQSHHLLLYEKIERLQRELGPHIKRLQERRPLITSFHLQQLGIKPGRIMGILLKEALRISIDEDIDETTLIIEKIKQHPLWPHP